MSLPAGVVTGSSSSRLSAPRTQAMIWSRIVLLPSIARPAVIAPLALVNAVMLETVTDFAAVIVPVAVTTGLIVVISLPATTVPPGAPLEPVLNVALVILNVVVLGTSATEAIDQEPLYTANPPVAPVSVSVDGKVNVLASSTVTTNWPLYVATESPVMRIVWLVLTLWPAAVTFAVLLAPVITSGEVE